MVVAPLTKLFDCTWPLAYGSERAFLTSRSDPSFETRSSFQKGNLPSLYKVLLRNRSFLATDPRDKVYGLLSLADHDDVETMKVQPDYHLSVDQLYKNITMSLLEQRGLRALGASGVVGKNDQRLPSWVSDWSVSDPSVPLDWVESEYGDRTSYTPLPPTRFRASCSTTSVPLFDHQKNLLGLDGFPIDEVETVGTLSRTRYLNHVSHMCQLFVHCHDSMQQLKNWEQVARVRSRERYVTGERNRDAYWHTLCAGRVPRDIKSASGDPRIKHHIFVRSLRRIVQFAVRLFPRSEAGTFLLYTSLVILLIDRYPRRPPMILMGMSFTDLNSPRYLVQSYHLLNVPVTVTNLRPHPRR